MPRWPAKTAASKTKAVLKPPVVKAARRAATGRAKTKMLQVGDTHIDPSTVVAIESVSALSCNILTEKFRVTAAVPHAAARQAVDTRTPLTTWASPEEIARHHLEMRQRISAIEAAYEREAGAADEPDTETATLQ